MLTWVPSKSDFLETKKDWNERICARLSLWNLLIFAIALYIVGIFLISGLTQEIKYHLLTTYFAICHIHCFIRLFAKSKHISFTWLTKKVTFGCENMQQYYMKWVLTNVLRLARGHCDRVVGTQMYSPNLYSNPNGEHWLSLLQGICDYNGSLHFRRNFPSQYPRSVVGGDLSQEIKERNWRKTGCTLCVINHKLLYFKYREDQKKIH